MGNILQRTERFFLMLLVVACCVYFNTIPAQAQSFGGALAIEGETIFVAETANLAYPGEIYLFEEANGAWNVATRLAPAEGVVGDGFGSAMAIQGDLLLAGAQGRSNGAGIVYVFQKNGSSWVEQSVLQPADLNAGDGFGRNLSIVGNTAFIAAPGYNEKQGAVYTFSVQEDGTWQQTGMITASDGSAEDNFGARVLATESWLFISAPDFADGSGKVYAFRKGAGDVWTEAASMMTGQPGDRLGGSLAIKENLLFVGAPRMQNRQGGVLVFSVSEEETEWAPVQTLTPFDAERFMSFGMALEVTENSLWVGAPGANERIGAIYVFDGFGVEGWSNVRKISTDRYPSRASFSSSIAVKGDLAVVGALGVDTREGAALIMSRNADGGWSEEASVVNEIKGFEALSGELIPCEEDEAAGFACKGIGITSFLPVQEIGGTRGVRTNDIWGWVDPETGKEYALVGRTNGTSFVDVSDPYHPVYIGDLPMTPGSQSSVWRDVKVYKDHAYVVADGAGQHGMQVLDLSLLRDVQSPPVTFEPTYYYDQIASAHNIVINEETGYAYAVGSSSGGITCGGGLHIINIENPQKPTFTGCFADDKTGRRNTGYTHDAQCVIYSGPDTEHQGKEICFGSNETALSIADVTDKGNPTAISMASYPKVAYTHQGWLTEDQRYFYMNDELDEVNDLVEGTRTLIWDVQDLDDPVLIKEHIAETKSIDHNLYIKGNLMYQSNYDAGLRILDISDPANPVEVAYFDTTPYEGGGGSWSNYPYFESGTIIVTSRTEGLFLLRKEDVTF